MEVLSLLRAFFALVSTRAAAHLTRFLATTRDARAVHYAVPLNASHIVEPDGTLTPVPPEYLAPWRQA